MDDEFVGEGNQRRCWLVESLVDPASAEPFGQIDHTVHNRSVSNLPQHRLVETLVELTHGKESLPEGVDVMDVLGVYSTLAAPS